MESYKCKFCFKSFDNGRALGGHMRSHMHKFSIQEEEERPSQLSNESSSDVSSSEEESSRNIVNLTRKRSKRTRKLDSFSTKKIKTSQLGYKAGPGGPEPEAPHHSSGSDTTTEEDLAFCLMMLSRDKWKKNKNKTTSNKEVGRYTCETCGKVFKSYQALGGHRASHKKNKATNKIEYDTVVVAAAAEKRVHECPICFRVFASGQALGGHKRSHGIGNLSVPMELVKEKMIDLNLPAPTEEDEVSMVFQ